MVNIHGSYVALNLIMIVPESNRDLAMVGYKKTRGINPCNQAWFRMRFHGETKVSDCGLGYDIETVASIDHNFA